MRREIFVYAKINFCIYEKIFPYIRKFPSVYNAENEMRRVFRNEMRQDGKTNCSGISLNIERAVKQQNASPLCVYECADGYCYLSCAIGSAIAVIVMLVN